MSDDRVDVHIGGDAHEGAAAVEEFAEKFESVFEALAHGSVLDLTKALVDLPAPIVAAGAAIGAMTEFLRECVSETAKLTNESISMGERLGVSTSEAQALGNALGDVGISTDSYVGAAQRLQRQVMQNEKVINAMGVETRNAKGELLGSTEQMENAIRVLAQYKEGSDRNQAAMAMFGRGAGDAAALLRLNSQAIEEAKEKADALGLTLGKDDVQAFKDYRAAQHEVQDVTEAFHLMLSRKVMPIFTDLAKWWADIAPTAIRYTSAAIDGLRASFHLLWGTAVIFFDGFKAALDYAGNSWGAFVAAIVQAVHGDFSGAWETLKAGARDGAEIFSKAGDEMAADAAKTADTIAAIYSNIANPQKQEDAGKEGPSGEKNFVDQKKRLEELAKLMKQQAEDRIAAILLEGAAFRKDLDSRRQVVLGAEQQALADKAALGEEYPKIKRRLAAELANIDREISERELAMARSVVEQKRQMAVDEVAFKRSMLDLEVSYGSTTKAEQLAQERNFQNAEYQANRDALSKNLESLKASKDQDKIAIQAANQQIENLDRQHNQTLALIDKKSQLERLSDFQNMVRDMQGKWALGIQSMLKGTLSFHDALRGFFDLILQDFIEFMVVRPLAEWAAGQALKLAEFITGTQSQTAAQATAEAEGQAIHKTAAFSTIMTDAAVAAAGAFAAIAAIPYVGPFIAPGAAAAAYAETAAWGAGLAAEGGFDVPAGLNPVTQLHQREMVLPENYANVIRDMADGGGGGGGRMPDFHVHAMDSQDVIRALERNGALRKAATKMMRNFRGPRR